MKYFFAFALLFGGLDVSAQNLLPRADILFVVDGSGSMTEYQHKLAENIGQFVDRLDSAGDLDYRIAVTIAGCYRNRNNFPMYSEQCEENLGVFHTHPSEKINNYYQKNSLDSLLENRLLVGFTHDHTETFFAPLMAALNRYPTFGRNALFVPIFFTDTEDQSRDSSGEFIDPVELYVQLIRLLGVPQSIMPFSFHIPSPEKPYRAGYPTCRRDPGGINNGVPYRIEEFIRLSQGISFHLCEEVETGLETIAEAIIHKARSK